jgi:hypothetical protein
VAGADFRIYETRSAAIGADTSEAHGDSELKLPGQYTQRHTSNHTIAARGGAVNTKAVWIAWGDVVESIERIDSELPLDTLMDREVLEQRKIVGEE